MPERTLHDLLDAIAAAEELRRQAGSVLRAARLDAGLTQTDVAAGMGVTKGYVNQIEKGKTTPSPTRVAAFAQIIEGGTHATSKVRRSAKEDLAKARKAKDD